MFGITGLRPKQDPRPWTGNPVLSGTGGPLGAAAGCASPADSGGKRWRRGVRAPLERLPAAGADQEGLPRGADTEERRSCAQQTHPDRCLQAPGPGAGCDRAGAPTQAAVPPSRYGPRSGFVPALHWFRPDINSNPLGILNCFLRQAIAREPAPDVENLGSCVKTGHDLWLFQKRISARGRTPKAPGSRNAAGGVHRSGTGR